MKGGSLSPGYWIGGIIGIIVLFLVVAALYPSLASALGDYNTSGGGLGSVLLLIIPILLGAALLLGAVGYFLGKHF